MIDRALELALQAHKGVQDKGGNAYILHPLRIMMRLRTKDEELMCIALLHDTIEDSDITLRDLEESGFSDRVIRGVDLLTHRDGEAYESYLARMQGSLDALLVKREDLRDNSDITRLRGMEAKDVARMIKYQIAFNTVESYIKQLTSEET